MRFLLRFRNDEDAVSMAEYSLVLALIGFTAAGGAGMLGCGMDRMFTGLGREVETATIPRLP